MIACKNYSNPFLLDSSSFAPILKRDFPGREGILA
jgi:hypothetical protein